jgi:hypothetical protein
MSGSVMLDVAIGVVFVFVLLSLACSAGGEIAESWLKYRAQDLERGIRELLAPNGGRPSATGLVASLFEHPLVSGLFQGRYEDFVKQSSLGQKLLRLWRGPSLPSYVPAANFALALLDIIKPAGAAAKSGAAGATRDRDPKTPLPADAAQAVQALRDQLVQDPRFQHVQAALLALVDAAENDVEKIRTNIETWFNNGMERVSGWYKRRAQTIIFVIGLILAAALNLDSIHLAQSLATDRPVRDSLVAAATAYAQQAGTPTAPPPGQPAPTGKCVDNDTRATCRLEKTIGQLKDQGLPIGWSQPNLDLRDFWTWVLRVLGWLLSALAGSLGAPFWFDLLNKIVMLRSTIKPKADDAATT